MIFQPVDEAQARKLPQHDFANPKVYITPATHRFIEIYVPSDGTTWASDYMRLRQENPDVYEVKSDIYNKYSLPFQKLCSQVKDNVTYFIQTTMKDDVTCVSGEANCTFKLYEEERIQHLSQALSKAKEAWQTEKDAALLVEITKGNELIDVLSELTESLNKTAADLESKMKDNLWSSYEQLLANANITLQKLRISFQPAPS